VSGSRGQPPDKQESERGGKVLTEQVALQNAKQICHCCGAWRQTGNFVAEFGMDPAKKSRENTAAKH
jgi:hypothetical protein